jgi:hypothetical protein
MDFAYRRDSLGNHDTPRESGMSLRTKIFLIVLFCLWVLPVQASALLKACAYSQPILTLADRLLGDLDAKDAYVASLYGRDAAYLKLYYGKMSPADIDIMLERLIKTEVSGASAFAYSYYLSTLGYEAANARINQRRLQANAGPYDLTMMRALAKAGHYDLAVAHAKGFEIWPTKSYLFPYALPFIDYPPEARKQMADTAESGGALVLAGELYASLPEYTAWKGFLRRNFDTIGYRNLKGAFQAFSALNFESMPLPDPKNRMAGLIYRKMLQKTSAISWLLPGPALLYEFSFEYKFEPALGARAAEKLKLAYDQGAFRPDGPVEQGWLLVFQALADVADDRREIIERMQTVKIDSRYYLQASAGAILDRMLAAAAIGPWLKGEISAFPAVPKLASAALRENWPEWQKLAEAINNGSGLGATDGNFTRLGMAAELLYAKGDAPALLALIGTETNGGFRQRMQVDFMTRYDRLCDSSLYFPGDGLFLRDTTIYRLEALVNDREKSP